MVYRSSVPNATGLCCGVNDPEGLYACMKQYYHDAALRKAHGAAGRKRVEETFDNKLVTQAWVEFYEGMLGGND